jgi:hypothetical protein
LPRGCAHDRRDLVERVRERVVQDEREPLRRRERLEHHIERKPTPSAIRRASSSGLGRSSTETIGSGIREPQLSGALGLVIFTAVSTSRTNHLLAAGTPASHAQTSGCQRAFLIGSIFVLASAVTALRATNTRGEAEPPAIDAEPEASLAA